MTPQPQTRPPHLSGTISHRGNLPGIKICLRSIRIAATCTCAFLATGATRLAAADFTQILYVDNSGGNDITLVDCVTNRPIGSIETGPVPHGMIANEAGTRLYVTTEGDDQLVAIDTTSSNVLWRRPLFRRPNELSISADGRFAFVPIRGSSTLDVVDTDLRRTIKSIEVGPSPHNSYRSHNGKWIFVTSMGDHSVAVVDIATQEVIGPPILLGGEPRPLAITADDRYLYVQLTGLHGFVVVDVAARKVIEKIDLPLEKVSQGSAFAYTPGHGICFLPGDRELWATNVYGNAVDVFSMPDRRLVATIPVGIAPNWMDVSADGKFVYVSNPGSNTVSVLNTETHREITQVPVGLAPKRVLLVQVPADLSSLRGASQTTAAARRSTTDYRLKGGGLLCAQMESFASQFQSNGLSAESAPAFCRNLGLIGVELSAHRIPSWSDAVLDRIGQSMRAEGRVLTALHMEMNLGSDNGETAHENVEAAKRVLSAARRLGAPIVTIGSGAIGRDEKNTVSVERTVLMIRQILPLARQLGARLAIETGSDLGWSAEEALRIIKETDPRSVGVCFEFGPRKDPASLSADLRRLSPHILHVHLNCSGFDRFGNETSLDYAKALALLGPTGYGGPLSIRFQGQGDPAQGVIQMRDLLLKIWTGLGTAPIPESSHE